MAGSGFTTPVRGFIRPAEWWAVPKYSGLPRPKDLKLFRLWGINHDGFPRDGMLKVEEWSDAGTILAPQELVTTGVDLVPQDGVLASPCGGAFGVYARDRLQIDRGEPVHMEAPCVFNGLPAGQTVPSIQRWNR